jgi:CBS-domain-containing membrane protein
VSARAAWRLEELGFTNVCDYVGGKEDWFANALPREGTSTDVPWAGDLVQDVATCAPDERVADVRPRVTGSGLDLCVVVNDERIVLGVMHGDALAKDPTALAGAVMELGPKTHRPNVPIEDLLASRTSHGVKSWIVTTPHGVLLGLVTRDDAEKALESRPKRPQS